MGSLAGAGFLPAFVTGFFRAPPKFMNIIQFNIWKFHEIPGNLNKIIFTKKEMTLLSDSFSDPPDLRS